MSLWNYARPGQPCQVCGEKKDCRTKDGELFFCRTFRHGEQPGNGFVPVGQAGNGTWGLFKKEHSKYVPPAESAREMEADRLRAEWEARRKELRQRKADAKRRKQLQKIADCRAGLISPLEAEARFWDHSLPGLDVHRVSRDFDLGFSPAQKCFVIDELAGDYRVVAQHRRYLLENRKQTLGEDPDQGRGLIVPRDHYELFARADQGVFCVEGFSDTAALFSHARVAAVGRPSNVAGVADLALLFSNLSADIPIYVVGENDRKDKRKPDGEFLWPGRDGAMATAKQLAALLGRDVFWVIVPPGTKDARDWLAKQNLPADHPDLKRMWVEHCQKNAHRVSWAQAMAEEETADARPPDADVLRDRQVEREARDLLAGFLDAPPSAEESAKILAARQQRLDEEAARVDLYRRRQEAAWENRNEIYKLQRNRNCGFCVHQVHPEKGIGQSLNTRCGQWTGCKFCRHLNARWHYEQAAAQFRREEEIWVSEILNEDRETRLRQIRRHGGCYKVVRQEDDCCLIFSTADHFGADPMSADAALDRFRTALDHLPHTKGVHPITTSRGWRPPRREQKAGFIEIGTWGPDLDAARQFLDQFREISLEPIRYDDSGGPIVRKAPFYFTCKVTPDLLENLRGWLAINSDDLDPSEWLLPADRSLRTPPPCLEISIKGRGNEENSDTPPDEPIVVGFYREMGLEYEPAAAPDLIRPD